MKKLFTTKTFIWSRFELGLLFLCFTVIGVFGTMAVQGGHKAKAPVLTPSYGIVIQDYDYVITQGNRIVSVVPYGGQLDSLIMADNL